MGARQRQINADRHPGLLACRSGASAAEFALLLPLLLLMLLGTLQVSMLMYSYNLMVSTARDTARAMAVCSITDLPAARNQAQKSRPPWLDVGDWEVTPVLASDVSMTIKVDPAKAAIINYLPLSLDQLVAHVVMKREPLAFGGSGGC